MTHPPARVLAMAAAIGAAVMTPFFPARPAAPGAALTIELASEPEPVFTWSAQACAPNDIPDMPARAYRDAAGRVRLIATHYINRALLGEDLNGVRPDCRVIFEAERADAPEAYGDRAWLIGPYTLDGATVYALVHNEFHGHLRPALCPQRSYRACWQNVVTWAASADGGDSFRQPGPAERLVAALPYRYATGGHGRRVGLFNPSNIVRHGGHYYVMLFADPFRAQRGGVCLLRTADLADPKSWRAWDGSDFTVRFADPYRESIAEDGAHVCAPVAPDRLTASVGSLTYHPASGLFVALLAGRRPVEPDGAPVSGIFAATSPDLVAWSWPRLVWAVPTWGNVDCAAGAFSVGYPSLLDPSSPSRNFETTDDDAYLYFTRFNLKACAIGGDRDLYRVRVRLRRLDAIAR